MCSALPTPGVGGDGRAGDGPSPWPAGPAAVPSASPGRLALGSTWVGMASSGCLAIPVSLVFSVPAGFQPVCLLCPSQQLVSCAAHSEVLLLSPQLRIPLVQGNGTYSPMSPDQLFCGAGLHMTMPTEAPRAKLVQIQFPGRLERRPGLCSGLRSLLDESPRPMTKQEARQASTVDGPSAHL